MSVSSNLAGGLEGGEHALARPDPLRTWWMILRISLEERLVYRGDFALGTLMRFLPLVTQIFLWSAIFASVAAHGGGTTIAGYTYEEMIAYFLLTQVSRAFSSMPGLASTIALQIRNGEIKKYLVQPVDLIGFLLLGRIAHKLVYYIVAAGPFALVFYLCRDYFSGWPDATTMLAFLASLIMAFLMGFFLEATLGLVGFWFLEVSSLLFIYMLFTFFFSGHMFPLDMLNELPGYWGTIVRAIPLQYLAYFPAAVFLGKIQGADLAWGLGMQLFWTVFFIGLCRLTFFLGVRRYSGYGGWPRAMLDQTIPIAPPGRTLSAHPSYWRVFLTFARNSLVRDMTFRSNFLIECITSVSWMAMNLGYYLLIYEFTGSIAGWTRFEFFIFLATTLLVNSIVQALFMPNCEEFSELIRTGGLDFALLKPIDTQFLISLNKINWSSFANFIFAGLLMAYSVWNLPSPPGVVQLLLFPLYVACGVAILYALMLSLAATSVWLGRNQTLYDFWFYITNFSRYPMEIYTGTIGSPLQWLFTFIIPVLVVVNVPARLLAKPLEAQNWPLAVFAVAAAGGSLWAARWIFSRAMKSYRSASS